MTKKVGGPSAPGPDVETREIFVPARILSMCIDDWESADDAELSRALGEAMEHAWWHWKWLSAVRRHKCRLVVIQARDPKGDVYPHYQIGDLFTLSGWHPERAVAEAQSLLSESGDGLTFDIPVDEELLMTWDDLAEEHELDDETSIEILSAAMMLLDEAHDRYVEELGEDFYVATRGLERDLDALVNTEDGAWSAETMQVVDKASTRLENHIFTEQPEGVTTPVPLVYQPEIVVDDETDEAYH